MKTQFVRNKAAQFWHMFGVAPPLPFRKNERRDTAQGGSLQPGAKLFVAMMLATALSAFAQENPKIAPRAIPVMPVAPAAAGPNDIARFLAGMPVPEKSPLAPLTRDQAWQAHSAFFEGEFTKLYQRQLQKLHAWEATYLPEVTQPVPVASINFFPTPRCTCFAGRSQWGRHLIRCASPISPARWEMWRTQ